MADSVWQRATSSEQQRRMKNTINETNMNIVNVMTCTMNITGESNCIMQLSVSPHTTHSYVLWNCEYYSVVSFRVQHACQAKTKSNEQKKIFFYYYFLFFARFYLPQTCKYGRFRSLQFTSSIQFNARRECTTATAAAS